MRSLATFVLALAAGVATAVLSVPAPASASVSGSTATTDVVLYDRCQLHDVSFSINVTPDTSFWRLEVQVFNPAGIGAEGSVFTSSTSLTHGVASFQFCGAEVPGQWTVRASGYYQTIPGIQTAYKLPDTAFQVSPAATRTGLRDHAVGGRHYRVQVHVVDQREHGFFGTDGATVRLERLSHGTWRKIGDLLHTFRGRDVARVGAPSGTRLRAVTLPNGNYSGSISRVIRLGR